MMNFDVVPGIDQGGKSRVSLLDEFREATGGDGPTSAQCAGSLERATAGKHRGPATVRHPVSEPTASFTLTGHPRSVAAGINYSYAPSSLGGFRKNSSATADTGLVDDRAHSRASASVLIPAAGFARRPRPGRWQFAWARLGFGMAGIMPWWVRAREHLGDNTVPVPGTSRFAAWLRGSVWWKILSRQTGTPRGSPERP